jgi:hypothetical protein
MLELTRVNRCRNYPKHPEEARFFLLDVGTDAHFPVDGVAGTLSFRSLSMELGYREQNDADPRADDGEEPEIHHRGDAMFLSWCTVGEKGREPKGYSDRVSRSGPRIVQSPGTSPIAM